MNFTAKVKAAQARTGGRLCVGLDPDLERFPEHLRSLPVREALSTFCRAIIDSTRPYACAFKPNFAFFEAHGSAGFEALEEVIETIPEDTAIVADVKRSDIGNTARMYARSVFESLNVDACTISPYMGRDSMTPFLAYPGKCVFVLARTSNAGSQDFQLLDSGGRSVFEIVADVSATLSSEHEGQVGFVVGATDPTAIETIASAHPNAPLLIPGVGAQGGSPSEVMAACLPESVVLINSSRSILYASSGPDFASAASESARVACVTMSVAG